MMNSLARTSSTLRPLLRHAAPARSMTVMSAKTAEEYKKENYNSRMKKTGRPVSPHVTIYAFPITALTSIANRATGMCLSFGCLGLGVMEMAGGSGSALSFVETLGQSSFLIAAPAKFCVAFPLTYHYLGGVRHMLWDRNPDMLTNEDAEKASYALLASSTVLSGIMMFV